MITRLSVTLLLLVCFTASFARPVAAGQGTFYEMTTGISKVVLEADTPYVELQYLRLRAEVYNETSFEWFWLGSSDFGWSARSQNLTITDNRTMEFDQRSTISLSWAEGQSLRWHLFRVDEYTYSFGIIVAFPINVTFPMTFVSATMMTRELEDQWTHTENCTRFGSPPSNGTLNQWGLSPDRFWRTLGAGEYKTYYLYEVRLSKPGSFQNRVRLTYTVPALLLLLVLAVSICFFRKLELQHSLTIYLGTAFFCLPFLINYAQLGLGPITFTEWLFYADIDISALLAIVSLIWFGLARKEDA